MVTHTMKHITLIVIACLLTVGTFLGVSTVSSKVDLPGAPKAAHAFINDACGWPYDEDGSIYDDGYLQFIDHFWDATRTYRSIGFDLKQFRMPVGDTCYRTIYGSVWDNDHITIQALTAHIRAWTCGTPRADWQLVSYGQWGQAVWSYGPNQVWSNGQPWGQLQRWVTAPDGLVHLFDFQAYGGTPNLCGRQSDNQITTAQDSYFTIYYNGVDSHYLNFNG